MTKVSVVTIVKNDVSGLRRTYDSVLEQLLLPYEWIIVDGDSIDGTRQLILNIEENYNGRLRLIYGSSGGIYSAMNAGLDVVSGDYVLFLNSGDELYDKSVMLLVDKECESGCDLFYGNSVYCDGEASWLKKARPAWMVFYGMFACHQAIYYRMSTVSTNRYNLKFRLSADYEFTARHYLRSRVVKFSDRPLCRFSGGGFSDVKVDLGRVENSMIQASVFNMGPILLSFIRFIYLSSNFLRTRFSRIYFLVRRFL